MYGRKEKSSSSPRIAGVQSSSTIESTLWGMTSGMAVILGIVLGLAEIAPASYQLQRVAWWRSAGPTGQGLACTSGNGARGGPIPP